MRWKAMEPRRAEFETEEDYREAQDLYERMLSEYEDEAQKAFGTRWLNRMRDSGLAEFTRRGNRKIYSRHRLECLRAAEAEHARLIIKENRNHGTN